MRALRITAAFFRRDWRIERSHRFPFVLEAVALLATGSLFFYLGESLGSTARRVDFFAFVVPGLIVLRLNGSLPRVVASVEAEIASGSAEVLAASPVPSTLSIIGSSAFELCRSLVLALCLLALAVGLFGASLVIDATSVAALTLGLSGATLLFFALIAATTGVVLLFRQGAALTAAVALALPVVCGAYFPVESLPQPIDALAQALPFRMAVDVMRSGLLDGTLRLGLTARLWATGFVAVGIGLALLQVGISRARRAGTLNQP